MSLPAASPQASLREKLDASSLSPHRRALAYHWLNTGAAAEAAGKQGVAEHCWARLEGLLKATAKREEAGTAHLIWQNWDQTFALRGLQATRSMVERHGSRLTPMEKKTYIAQLSEGGGGRAGYWGLRRAISERLLRSHLNARRAPVLRTQLAVYGENLPVGPYNHRKTLESALRMVEGLDAGWVRDFLRTYTEGLTAVKSLASAAP